MKTIGFPAALIERSGNLTAAEVSARITRLTGIPTSPRTVENWRIGRFLPPVWKQGKVLSALSRKKVENKA